MIRHLPFVVALTLVVSCGWINKVDPPNVPQPGHACANGQHQCWPGRGCCLDDDETCCGLPESVGCGDAKTGCLFIGNSLGGPRGEPQIRPGEKRDGRRRDVVAVA